jgi:hypothetical protein
VISSTASCTTISFLKLPLPSIYRGMNGRMDGRVDGRKKKITEAGRDGNASWMGLSRKLNGMVTVSGQKRKIYCNTFLIRISLRYHRNTNLLNFFNNLLWANKNEVVTERAHRLMNTSSATVRAAYGI